MSEFEAACRLCLRQSEEKMVNISKFDDIIALIANLRLVKHPLIPRKICKNCASILLAAAMMRVNCVESNKYFISYLESKNEVPLTNFEAEEYEAQLEADEVAPVLEIEQKAERISPSPLKIEEQQPKNTKAVTVKRESSSPAKLFVGAKSIEDTKGFNCQNCRLCLKRFPVLPAENTVANMKEVVNKIMDMKSFERAQTMIPDKVCDDCLGNVLTASIVADRCKKAYKYFYTKASAVITSTSCMVSSFED